MIVNKASTIPKKYPISCRVKGLQRIELYVKPTLKDDVKKYCQQRGFTMSDLITKLLREQVQ